MPDAQDFNGFRPLPKAPLPILPSMAHTQNKRRAVVVYNVNNQMGFVRMDTHRRRDLAAFARNLRMTPDQIKDLFQFAMIALRLSGPKQPRTFNEQADDVLFGFAR